MTNSEWDNVDFCLIELNNELISIIKGASEDAVKLKEKYPSFDHIELDSDIAEWFIDASDDTNDNDKLMALVEEKEFVIIDEEIETATMHRPEQDIRYGSIRLDGEVVKFVAYGKHTNEEFFTESIPIKDIISSGGI